LVVGVALASTLVARAARAEAPIELTWRAPASCPGEREVWAGVERRLGQPAGGLTGPRSLGVSAVVEPLTRPRGRLRLTLRTTRLEGPSKGERGERVVDAASCADLAEAASLIIAMAFDPAAVALTEERAAAPLAPSTQPAPLPPGPPVLAPPPHEPVAPPPREGAAWLGPLGPSRALPHPDATPRPRALVSALALVDLGSLPEPSPGLGVGLGLRWSRLRVEGRFGWWPSSRRTLPSGKGGELSLVTGALVGCVGLLPPRGRVELAPCAALELGRIEGRGFGVSSPSAGDALWVAPELGLVGRVSLTPWLGARLDVRGAAPLARPDFVLSGVGVVHTSSPVVGRLGLGLELSL
jgi:hypothetical protein